MEKKNKTQLLTRKNRRGQDEQAHTFLHLENCLLA